MNEAETRAEHIDPALKAAGWGVVEGSRILREYHIIPDRIEGRGRRGTPKIADYVLVYRNLKLAVNEAKAWDKAVAQAKAYAEKLNPLLRLKRHIMISDNLAAWLEAFPPPLTCGDFGRMLSAVKKHFNITHDEARHSFISYHVAAHRSLGDAALQAGNSESIIKRHYLNLHPREEGGQFFRIVPDKERRRAVLAPEKAANPNPHLVAV